LKIILLSLLKFKSMYLFFRIVQLQHWRLFLLLSKFLQLISPFLFVTSCLYLKDVHVHWIRCYLYSMWYILKGYFLNDMNITRNFHLLNGHWDKEYLKKKRLYGCKVRFFWTFFYILFSQIDQILHLIVVDHIHVWYSKI